MGFTLVTGATLGRYQLLVPLGQGGMGSVWVAREESPTSGRERLVAIKVMRPEFAAHSKFRAMFLEEGQLVRSIEHDNVVQVFEVAEHSGILWLTMEWVEGESLDTLFREASRRRPIPAEMAVRIIADTAKGLHAAHELRGWDGELAGIVHRDVSPHNILIGVDGRIKIADFGLARATENSGMPIADGTHGKYSYMSPEQARGQAVDRRSDVFSLGVVLYELTTGERLFKGEDRHHTLGLVMQCKVPDPRSLQPGYSPGLENIVMKALANKPSDRFQSAEELRVALEKLLVSERTLVSTGSVAALLRRVVGKRLEKQRQQIHDALVQTVGHAKNGLLPDTSLLTGASQVSEVSEPGRRIPSQPGASETPHAVSHSRISLTAPVAPQKKAMLRLAVWGGGGAAAAFSLMLVLGKLMGQGASDIGEATGQQPASTDATMQRALPANDQAEDDGSRELQGLSVSDLPVEEIEQRRRDRARLAPRPAPAAPAPPAAKPAWLEQVAQEASGQPPPTSSEDMDTASEGGEPTAAQAAEQPELVGETDPDAAPVDPNTSKVVLEEEQPEPPPPKAPPKESKPYQIRVPGMERDTPGF